MLVGKWRSRDGRGVVGIGEVQREHCHESNAQSEEPHLHLREREKMCLCLLKPRPLNLYIGRGFCLDVLFTTY